MKDIAAFVCVILFIAACLGSEIAVHIIVYGIAIIFCLGLFVAGINAILHMFD